MLKTASFAIVHFSVAFTVTYLLTGSLLVGGAVALIEPGINTLVFYFHDKIWSNIEAKRRQRGGLAGDTHDNTGFSLKAGTRGIV